MAAEPRTEPLETPSLAAPVFSPSFDSGGSAMFFHVGRSPQARIVEGRLDEDEQLVEVRAFANDGSRNYHARLSPDGTHVAFDSDRDGERGVYITRRDGTMPRRVSGAGFAAVPTWSPDGTHLAFVRGELSRPSVWNLWLLDVVSGELERVTSYRYGQLWGASWFPDGKRVCYSHEGSLYLMNLVSRAQERFDSPVRGRLVRTPAVSPDGRRIVFQLQGDGVWMLELDDRTMRRILDDSTAEEFTWDVRGARVAYHSRRDGHWRIWVTTPPLPSDPTP
jgi:Tol biopolymer transport system component